MSTTAASTIDWITYGPGEHVQCPVCKADRGIVGAGRVILVRKNPLGRSVGPTAGAGYSEHCKKCNTNIEWSEQPTPKAKA